MQKNCKYCNCLLTNENAAKKNKKYFRNECKPCRSKSVTRFNTGNEKRNTYVRSYLRRIGKVKEYSCEQCGQPCYKKYAKAFCSDKCRFMSYVVVTPECWVWIGAKNKSGYGKISFKDSNNSTSHRVSYKLFKGNIPEGMLVCHTCDNPTCVNPTHLWLGTIQQNTADMMKKGRSLYGEKQNLAKLTARDILRIRELDIKGWTQKKISDIYNITTGHVNNIVKKRVWKHI